MEDAEFLFNLKNDEDVRAFAIKTHDKIDWSFHLGWLKDHLKNIQIIMWEDKPIGDIRQEDEIAIKIRRDYRGLGFGSAILNQTEGTARVVDGNVYSMRAFINAGYNVVDHKENYYILEIG